MKRILVLLLMLVLLTACGEEAKPSVRYENDAAYYEQEGAELSMELQFAAPVAKGSEIKLLNGETEVLSLTVEKETKTLTLRSDKLEKNVAYTLTVNGVMQQHGAQSLQPPSPIVDIPDQPTIPMEPMSEQPSENAGGFTPGAGTQSGMGTPPDGMEQPSDGSLVPMPSMDLEPPTGERPEPPSEGFGGQRPLEGGPDTRFDNFTFMITSENQSFTNVCDAVRPEGKEPKA